MMPYQDDDLDTKINTTSTNQMSSQTVNLPPPPPSTGMSKAELRKSNKPIMEKKRRARINHCLNELKTLILEAMRKDPARHTKLEKADILEMTVKHLQTIQRQQLVMAVSTDPTVVHKFKSGFVDCAEEVNRYISQMEGLDLPVKQRLMNHLNNCVSGLQQISPFNFGTGFNGTTQIHNTTAPIQLQQDINNNGRIQMGGVQFIPSRLPTGELALVMPNSSSLPFFPSSATTNFTTPSTIDINTNYPRVSAFNTVTKNRPIGTSPPLSPISSISSIGEDSSPPTDYNQLISPTTPPLQLQSNHNLILNVFPTPPSNGLFTKLSTLQQPHISSTTETPKSITNSVISQSNLIPKTGDVYFVNKKRPYPVDLSDTQTDHKLIKLDSSTLNDNNNNNNNNYNLMINEHQHNLNNLRPPSPNDNMWRPW